MLQAPSRWLYPAFSQAVCLYIPAAEDRIQRVLE